MFYNFISLHSFYNFSDRFSFCLFAGSIASRQNDALKHAATKEKASKRVGQSRLSQVQPTLGIRSGTSYYSLAGAQSPPLVVYH